MMTGPSKAKNPANLSVDEIIKALEKTTKVFNCPVCTKTEWTVINDEKTNFGVVAFPKDGGFSIPPSCVPVAAVACNNCGYIRTHALAVLATKL